MNEGDNGKGPGDNTHSENEAPGTPSDEAQLSLGKTDLESSARKSQDPETTFANLGEKLFQWRDYTPVPLIFVVLFTAEPSARSATIGTLVAIFGELLRIYAVSFIGSVSRTRNTETTGGNLITDGPFGWVRNPLYVGNFFIAFGLAIFGGVLWVTILTTLLFLIQYHCIVKYEEGLLTSKFGKAYERYMETVPAWIPSQIPELEEWAWPPSFSEAIRSERRTLTAIGLMLLALMVLA